MAGMVQRVQRQQYNQIRRALDLVLSAISPRLTNLSKSIIARVARVLWCLPVMQVGFIQHYDSELPTFDVRKFVIFNLTTRFLIAVKINMGISLKAWFTSCFYGYL
jgi:hypothetical protein